MFDAGGCSESIDTVNWNALESILNEVDCLIRFTKWIMTAVTTVSYRFNVNECYIEIIEARRGLRQGDPISPILFVIVMEWLNRYLFKMQKDSNFNYHPKCEKLKIINLCFADDFLMFTLGDKDSIEMMMKTFGQFSKVTAW